MYEPSQVPKPKIPQHNAKTGDVSWAPALDTIFIDLELMQHLLVTPTCHVPVCGSNHPSKMHPVIGAIRFPFQLTVKDT